MDELNFFLQQAVQFPSQIRKSERLKEFFTNVFQSVVY